MQTRRLLPLTLAALATSGSIAAAQTTPAPQSALPAVRPLGPTVRASTPQFGSVSAVRALSNGTVIVNDVTGRRVVLFDSTLANATVIADSTSATATAYSSRIGGLIPYRGDSTLFVDPTSLSMMVIDPAGKIGRVMAVPRPQDATFLIGGPFGVPGFDAAGHVVYRAQLRPPRPAPGADGKLVMPDPIDSAAIIRFDLDKRRADTAAYLKIAAPRMTMSQDNGRIMVTQTVNPLPITDDWALLSDGTIAIVRGRDYRVDWVAPDGAVTKGPKIPFEWQRLTDADKDAVIDSTRKAMEAQRARMNATLSGAPGAASGPGGAAAPPTGARGEVNITFEMRRDGGGPPAASGGSGAAGATIQLPPLNFVSPSEMPDYRPAFSSGAARADADGNLWIRTSQFVNGGQVYDVVNRKGELTDRVQLPPGRAIAGFGAGGIVFLGVRDGTTGVRLEKARVR